MGILAVARTLNNCFYENRNRRQSNQKRRDMPGRDGTGPRGEGPLTGGGFGPCGGGRSSRDWCGPRGRGGRGRGRSVGRGAGRGMGAGRGPGFGAMLNQEPPRDNDFDKEQLKLLQEQVVALTSSVSQLKSALTKLSAGEETSTITPAGDDTDKE